MAVSRLSVLVAALACCCLARLAQCGGGGGGQNYTSMFSFGDSLTDTGNLLVSSPLSFNIVGRFPYGMTYFHRPTGRCSDGRLVVDFLAQAFGLPLLQPYLSRGEDVRQGVNFAVGGATAMDPPFFEGIGASDKLWTNLSLSVQLDWFDKLKPSLCGSPKSSSSPPPFLYQLAVGFWGQSPQPVAHCKIPPLVFLKSEQVARSISAGRSSSWGRSGGTTTTTPSSRARPWTTP
uniref:GDSL esterase/lipase n=1 Tax=Triticum urartu TaxID=4572 RepID=A0A8R7PR68_TRIUA